MNIKHYYKQLQHTNEELEMEIQAQCDQVEKLTEEVEKLKFLLTLHKAQIKKLTKAGNAMHDFVEEMISCDYFCDEQFDEANKVVDKWSEIK
jgi:wobble nucleotide-excising tRNase